jgi:bacterioferritin-associated ferredoxin
MIICSCNAISDQSVRASLTSRNSPRTPGAVYRCLGCRPCCGRCFATVRAIIDETLSQSGAASVEAGAAASAAMALLDTNRDGHAQGACGQDCASCAAA